MHTYVPHPLRRVRPSFADCSGRDPETRKPTGPAVGFVFAFGDWREVGAEASNQESAASGEGRIRPTPPGRSYPVAGVIGRDEETEMAAATDCCAGGTQRPEKVGESEQSISVPFTIYLRACTSSTNPNCVNVSQNRPGYRAWARNSNAAATVAPRKAPGEMGAKSCANTPVPPGSVQTWIW